MTDTDHSARFSLAERTALVTGAGRGLGWEIARAMAQAGAHVLLNGRDLGVFNLTNTVPGIAVVIVAMGLLQRDGLLVIFGSIVGTAWIASLVFAGATLVSLIRAWFGI